MVNNCSSSALCSFLPFDEASLNIVWIFSFAFQEEEVTSFMEDFEAKK